MTGPATPADSPLTLADVMASPVYRRLMTPAIRPGELASPFELPLLDPETQSATGARVRLDDFRGRQPVALVFGSYT